MNVLSTERDSLNLSTRKDQKYILCILLLLQLNQRKKSTKFLAIFLQMQVLSGALTSDWLAIVWGYVGCRKLNALIKVPFRRGYFTVRLWIDRDIRVLLPVTGHLLYNQFPFQHCPTIWTIKKLETADARVRDAFAVQHKLLGPPLKPLLLCRGWTDTAPHAVTQQLPSDNRACAQLFVSSKMPPSETTTAGLRLCNREGGFVFWKKQLFFRQRRSMERVHNNRNEK